MSWRTIGHIALAAGLVIAAPSMAHAQPGIPAADARAQQWHLDYLDIAKAHELSRGQGVTIGMIDTGVDAGHPDLKGVIRGGKSFGDTAGDPLRDEDNHGTGVASVLAGRGHGAGNADGILGIAPEAEVIPVKLRVSDGNKNKHSYWMGEAIQYLVDQDVDVITISLGSDYHELGQEAVDNARRKGIQVVAGAGNTVNEKGIEIDTMRTQYPAYYRDVVAVTGVDQNGAFWKYSVKLWSESDPQDYGVAGPAVDIPVATPGGGYELGSGTSLAAPIVAGTFALLKARYPNASWAELGNHLLVSADNPKGDTVTNEYGYGIIDPLTALTNDIPGQFPVNPDDAPADGGDSLPGPDEIESRPPSSPNASPQASDSDGDSGGDNTVVLLAGALSGGAALLLGVLGLWLRSRQRTSGRTP